MMIIIIIIIIIIMIIIIIIIIIIIMAVLRKLDKPWGVSAKMPYYAKMGACPMKNSGMTFTFM